MFLLSSHSPSILLQRLLFRDANECFLLVCFFLLLMGVVFSSFFFAKLKFRNGVFVLHSLHWYITLNSFWQINSLDDNSFFHHNNWLSITFNYSGMTFIVWNVWAKFKLIRRAIKRRVDSWSQNWTHFWCNFDHFSFYISASTISPSKCTSKPPYNFFFRWCSF